MNIQDIASQLRDKLIKYDDFKGLYVYGSQVKGTANADSDIDIVAIFNDYDEYNKSKSIFTDLLEIELEFDVLIDFHPFTEAELNLNYIFYDEVKKGIYYGGK